ncbi:MAG: VCBS repeat-containing protein, partial [Anaerolineales bacterium]|nr:VCBS repeat-containing protein [Anaerolineales bacterium]
LFLTGCCGGGLAGPDEFRTINAHNTVWLSGENNLPRYTGQKMSSGSSEAVALGDLDGDGDLDAFIANSAHLDDAVEMLKYDPNEVWLNDGIGIFTDSGQRLGNQRSYSVALGDLDGDGDLDAVVGNLGTDEVLLNDGTAVYSDSGQRLRNSFTRYVYLADLDGDGDLDAFLGSDTAGRIWLNDGQGNFKVTSQKLKYSRGHAVVLGDVNRDGTVDVVAGKLDGATVWFNDGTGRMK